MISIHLLDRAIAPGVTQHHEPRPLRLGIPVDAAAGKRYFTLGYDLNMQDFALLFWHNDRGVLPLSLLSEMRICLLSSSDSSIADVSGAVTPTEGYFFKRFSNRIGCLTSFFKTNFKQNSYGIPETLSLQALSAFEIGLKKIFIPIGEALHE